MDAPKYINELCIWSSMDSHTEGKYTVKGGWDDEEYPEPTQRNMLILVNKINVLIEQVNFLSLQEDQND